MDQLEEIKNKINIVDFISEHLPLKKAGRNFKALCPFHSEKTPSFVVSPERQIWHCFGQCGEGGDIFKFLMKMENIEFGEALQILAKRAGVKLQRYQLTGAERQKSLLYEINHLASEFFHYLLLNHPAGKGALSYIFGRGINRASLQLFRLGFAPDSWDSLQQFLVVKKGYQLENVEGAGLIIKRETQDERRKTRDARRETSHANYYDRFRNRLMFPLKDHRGNVCGFAGRTLDPEQTTAKYVNTPETILYHKSDLLYGLYEAKEMIKQVDEVILVEGELDMISSYQVGVKNVVAIKGSALTPNQVRLLSRFTKNITLALDQDLAGDQAAKRGIEVAESAGMAIKVIQVQGGKDPDEVAQKKPRLWRELTKRAVGVYDYFLDSAFSQFDRATAEGKRKISQELIPIWAKISDEIVQSHYMGELAKHLGVAEEAVMREIERVKRSGSYSPQKEMIKIFKEKKERREILEEYLLALCFQTDHWRELRKRKVISLIKTPRFGRILKVLGKYFKRYKTVASQRLVKMLAPELKEAFDQLYLLELPDLKEDEEKFDQELAKTLDQLGELVVREELKTISQEIEKLEQQRKSSGSEKKKLKTLYREFRDLSGRLAEFRK